MSGRSRVGDLKVSVFRQRIVGVGIVLPEERVESDAITTFKKNFDRGLNRQI